MKVLDLQCEQHHVFEGWFASEDDFQSQLARQLIACPLCASTSVLKLLSAPRLNLGATPPAAPSAEIAPTVNHEPKDGVMSPCLPSPDVPAQEVAFTPGQQQALAQLQNAYLAVARHVLKNTEDVGNQFASEARKIHYGESPERGIRGQATPDQVEALRDEGISIGALPLPDVLKEPLH